MRQGVSRAGPLPLSLSWASRIKPGTISLFCERPPCEPAVTARGSALRGADGHDTGARLRCEVDGELPILSVTAEGRLAPGLYSGSIRLAVTAHEAVIPVSVEVRAAWPWIALPLLLGVLPLRTMSFIAEQRQLAEARAIVLGLINTRILLALLVAWILQTVRLSAHAPFGAKPTDYFEAFAIGAGSQAGLEGLLSVLSN